MFDTVNAVFYGNVESDELIAGPAWNGLPKDYKQLEYIETTGTQYIDTGFIPNQDTRVVCEFMFTSKVNLSCLYGSKTKVGSNDYSFRLSSANNVMRWQPIYGTQYGTFTDIPVDTDWHISDHNKNEVYFDNVLKTQSPFTYTEFTAPNTLAIGASKTGSSVSTYCKARFKSFKIYDNGIMVRDLLPCKASDGRIGMYDTLNGVFYDNKGTDNFVAGNEI